MTALGVYVLGAVTFDLLAIFEYAFLLARRRRAMVRRCSEKRRIMKGESRKSLVTFTANDPIVDDATNGILREGLIDQRMFLAYIVVFLLFNIAYFTFYVIIGPEKNW